MIHVLNSILFILLSGLVYFISFSSCSHGDNYPSYRSCVHRCRLKNCSDQNSGYSPTEEKYWFIEVLWDCYSDCEYECMWPTVDLCVQSGRPIPQFGGKWPFIRWLGMQEPASVLFSLFNLLSTLFMYKLFFRLIQKTSVMYWTWTGHAVMTVNAWTWSIVYHSRDVPFTESMDYIGSSSLIYYTFFALGLRIFMFQHVLIKLFFILGCVFLFAQHIWYLSVSSFDYNYNFRTLTFIGILTGVTTLIWCSWNYSKAKHVKYLAAYILFTMVTALLEIYDFPPFLWTFDAHSLWHLGTVPLSYFLYNYKRFTRTQILVDIVAFALTPRNQLQGRTSLSSTC